MTEDENARAGTARARGVPLAIYILAAVLAAIAGFGVMVLMMLWRPGDAVVSAPQIAVQQPAPEAGSDSGLHRLVRLAAPQALPDFAFTDGDGRERTLAEWKGRAVLVNLWATWCAPCKIEMPSLDRLQAKLGGDDFAVLPISLDRTGPDKPRDFLAANNLANLGLFLDGKSALMQALRAPGLPLTVIVDRAGCEVARLAGPAEWDSPEAEAVMREAIAAPGGC